MLFASGFFLTYFLPLIIILYWLAPKSFRNPLLLIASLFFYAWGEPLFVFLLLAVSLLNYLLVHQMHRSKRPKHWLIGYIIVNLSLLVAFKYVNFLVATTAGLLGWTHPGDDPLTSIALPLGISFYAFHAITYGVDVFRGTFSPQRRIDQFFLYLFLFPHQIAGPIVTYQHIAHELEDRKLDWENLTKGLYRFCVGLGKKVILSNGLIALIAVCNEQQAAGFDSTTMALVEMVAYTFHIYFDFSGYSDMAIGLARIFGFHFPENFDRPYTARSITEFWQRWHMSLGYFMKHYLYIPLGGNRVKPARLYFNLFLVFFLSGLWHGASWNFILWGVYHGLWLIIERLWLRKYLDKLGWTAGIWTFIVVLNGWVLFHETSFADAISTYSHLWSFDFQPLPLVNDLFYFKALLGICAGLIVLEYLKPLRTLRERWLTLQDGAWQTGRFAWMFVLYLISYSYVVAGSYNPFIYFNF